MITFDQLDQLFTFETKNRFCVEIFFVLTGSEKYDCCWMGKLFDRRIGRDVYWYGLTPDGQNAYDYPTFEEMADAPVFDGASLKEVWDRIVIEEIDGCDPEERLQDYLGGTGPHLGSPRPVVGEAVERIKRMEGIFDALRKKRDPEMLRELTDYYEGGLWLHDYELDEAGLLPPDLKRGVLAQDAFWDYLNDTEDTPCR